MVKRLNALLPIARWTVIGLAAAILVLSFIGLYRFPDYAARHLNADVFTPNSAWTGALVQQGLAELGWPPLTAAWFVVIQDGFGLVLFYSILAIILWKKSRDWFGLFLMTVFIVIGPSSGIILKPALEILPGLSFIINRVLGAVNWQLFFLLFFFFPNGRPVPAWTGWFTVAYTVFMVAAVAIPEINTIQAGSIIGTLMVVLSIGSQIYRYLHQPEPAQRQQTKWVVFVLGYFLLLLPVMFLFGFQTPPAGSLGPALLKDYGLILLARLEFWLAPATITIAVLRYRLWDIDLIIRRTLQYGLLTVLLGLVYFGSVVLLQQVFRVLSGQNSPLVVVVSTLVIVVLFTPLRRRIQTAIDQRFFRSRYSAEQALATFAAAARSEVELEALRSNLVITVRESLEPESISLWLKKQESK